MLLSEARHVENVSGPAQYALSMAVHSQYCWLVGAVPHIIAAVQMGFFSIVGIPLFKAMADLFEESRPMLDGVLANYRHWEAATPDADLPA